MGWFSWPYYMILFLFISSSVSSSSISLSSPSPLCHIDESNALLQFKNSFSIYYGDAYICGKYLNIHHPKTISWESGTDCCAWRGVTCNNITGHVIGLDLTCSMLGGILHSNSSLFLLRHLQTLILSTGTNFKGSTIPPEFGTFSDLLHLEIRYAHLSGDIPLQISYLSKLQTLEVYDYPDQQLRLNKSTFKRIVTNLTNLQNLTLYSVDMSRVDPTSLMNLSSSLQSLELWGCGLRGNSPTNIFQLPKLEILSLGNNENLTGSLPKYNWSSSLRELDLSFTNFSIDIPDLTRNLKSLQGLYLSNCRFIGSYLVLFGNLTQLTSINLSYNNISGQIPWSSFNPNLQYLDLRSNLLQGHLTIPLHSTIVVFKASSNQLIGEVPSLICNLRSLEVLDLANNSLSGKLPPCIGNLSGNLSVLDLRMNKFHGTIPTTLFEKKNILRNLNLNGNEFEGLLPRSLLNCKKLEVLDIGNNQINDTFPHWLESLPMLQVLILRSNKFIVP